MGIARLTAHDALVEIRPALARARSSVSSSSSPGGGDREERVFGDRFEPSHQTRLRGETGTFRPSRF